MAWGDAAKIAQEALTKVMEAYREMVATKAVVDRISTDVDRYEARLNAKVDAAEERLSKRIDRLEERIDAIHRLATEANARNHELITKAIAQAIGARLELPAGDGENGGKKLPGAVGK